MSDAEDRRRARSNGEGRKLPTRARQEGPFAHFEHRSVTDDEPFALTHDQIERFDRLDRLADAVTDKNKAWRAPGSQRVTLVVACYGEVYVEHTRQRYASDRVEAVRERQRERWIVGGRPGEDWDCREACWFVLDGWLDWNEGGSGWHVRLGGLSLVARVPVWFVVLVAACLGAWAIAVTML